MRRPLAPTLAVLLAVPAAAEAATRCVPAPELGCDSSHLTIGTAVTAASSGDTIRIAAGTYPENVDAGVKRLNFVGAGGGTLASDAGATVIAPASGAALAMPAGGSAGTLRAKGGSASGVGVLLAPAADGSHSYALIDVIAVGGPSQVSDEDGGSGIRALSPDAGKLFR